jgi:hypothetical protein
MQRNRADDSADRFLCPTSKNALTTTGMITESVMIQASTHIKSTRPLVHIAVKL